MEEGWSERGGRGEAGGTRGDEGREAGGRKTVGAVEEVQQQEEV